MMIRPGLDSVVVVVVRGASLGIPAIFRIPLRPTAPPHSSYHTSPSAVPAPAPLAAAAAPAPAPSGPPGVMSVAEFNRSGNGISAWINRMMYSALDKGHPTFTHFPTDKQHLWFRQFAQEFNWNS
uniref:Uncharacterized protein n=1 Tax=Brassica oleracea var. oleracea TaxID=109376 RepID=A0A0D2ZY01_BRAOL